MRAAALLLLAALAAAAPLDELSTQCSQALRAGRLAETRTLATRLLEEATAAKDTVHEALAHYYLGEAEFTAGDLAAALPHYQASRRLCTQTGDRLGVAYNSLCVGLCARALRQYTEALAALDQGATLYRELGKSTLSGRCRLLAGDILLTTGRLAEADTATREAVKLLRGGESDRDLADALSQLATLATGFGRPAEARALLEEALPIARRTGEPEALAKAYNNLGMLALGEGDAETAVKLLRQAVETAGDGGDEGFRLNLRTNLAQALQARGEGEAAATLFRQAAAQARQAKLPDAEAIAWTGLAVLLTELGQFEAAREPLRRAEDLRRELADELGLAVVRVHQAGLDAALGDLRGALATYLAVLPAIERQGLKELAATTRNNIGRMYDRQGDLEQAMPWFEQAERLAEEAGRPVLLATARSNKALALFNAVRPALPLPDQPTPEEQETVAQLRGILQQARDAFTQAAAILEQVSDRRALATVYNNLGEVASELHEPDAAAQWLEQALALHRQLGQRLGVCQTTANLGLIAFRAGQTEAAVTRFGEALAQSRQLGDLELEGAVLFNLALVDLQQGHAATGIERLYRSVDLTERRRSLVGGGEAQQRQFLASNVAPFIYLIQALLDAGRPEEAFAVAERAKGRALLDMMAGGRVDLRDKLPPEAAQKLTALERQLAGANLQLNTLAGGADTREAQLDTARAALEAARTALQAEETRLASLYPDLAASTGRQPLDFAHVAATLPADTALVQYVFGPKLVYAFVLTHAGAPKLSWYPVATGEVPIIERVRRFHDACANPRRRYKADGAALYDALLKPAVAGLPAGVKRLVIVPDGALYDCPFQALWREAEQRFISDDYELVYAASASLLVATLHLGDERRGQAAQSMLLVADPDFGGMTQQAAEHAAAVPPPVRGFHLSPLPGTREEAKAIAALMPGAKVLTGKAAQESAVKAEMPKARYLHFATHGLLDPEQPLFSAIALAEPDGDDDGFLEARELTRMTLSAELVTLSACQSGRGQAVSGEGLIGLPWAFFVARVPTQVVSLWSVDDFMTKELMARFYGHLVKGEGKASSLRAAAAELRAANPTNPDGQPVVATHPYYWAPFIVLGDWR